MNLHAARDQGGAFTHPSIQLPVDLFVAVEEWISRQPAPRPSLEEAVEAILRQALRRPALAEFST